MLLRYLMYGHNPMDKTQLPLISSEPQLTSFVKFAAQSSSELSTIPPAAIDAQSNEQSIPPDPA